MIEDKSALNGEIYKLKEITENNYKKYIIEVPSERTIKDYYARMWNRCSGKYPSLGSGYEGVTICEEWQSDSPTHVPEAFRQWMIANWYVIKDWPYGKVTLDNDHDIKNPKNKVYCPEYCDFYPHSINSAFGGMHFNTNSKYLTIVPQTMDGVSIDSNGLYHACGVLDATFSSQSEAIGAYVEHWDMALKNMCDIWAPYLPDRIIENIYNRRKIFIAIGTGLPNVWPEDLGLTLGKYVTKVL